MLSIVFTLILSTASSWPDTIPVLDLQFDQTQWEYAQDYYWEDIYVPAQLTLNNFTYTCQFRIRGATSREYPKKSIKIELPEDLYLWGKDELNLNAEYLDRTKIRECLSYLYYARTGQIVPEVHFVELRFNGETQGAYLSVEDIDEDFLLGTELPDDAVIYKCSDRYTTLDRVDNLEPYSKKTHQYDSWDDFLLLLYWLKLCPDDVFRTQLELRFHYGDLISCLATNVLLGHGSTYYHNYHLLLDETGATGRWRYITWDMDRTWWKYGPEFPYSKNSSNDGHRRNTLIWRMWCNDSIREELFTEIHEQYPLLLAFSGGNTIDSLANLIAPLVEADPFRDYTMDQFWGEVNNLENWPEARYSMVLEQIDQWPLPFSIYRHENSGEDLIVSWQSAGNSCIWRLVVSADSLFTNPADVVYESFPTDTFHILSGHFTGENLWMQIFATRNGVEHRSNNGPVVPVQETNHAISGNLIINEINYMSAPQFNPGDWFEVVNASDEIFSLAGWSIRDANTTNLTTIGELLINPGQCMVFSSDSFAFINTFEMMPSPSHWLTFNLSDNGDEIKLFDPLELMIDSVSYLPEDPWPLQAAGYGSTLALLDTSLPNEKPSSWVAGQYGGTPFSTDISTPDWPGRGAVSFLINGPVPVTAELSLKLNVIAPVIAEITLYDTSGRVVLNSDELNLETGVSDFSFDTNLLPSGVYFVAIKNMGYLQTSKITILRTQ